jgi:nucleotide-binding universal stress UspA family protein
MSDEEAVSMASMAQAAGARQRIVVGVDDSSAGLAALQWAVSAARSSHAQLVAVRSWALGLPRHGGRRRRAASAHPHVILYFAGTAQSAAAADLVRRAFRRTMGGIPDDVVVTIETPEGEPGTALTGIAVADGDLLVVGGRRDQAIRRLIHGSVSRYCCEHSKCPVVVVSADDGQQRGQAA